MLTLSALAAGAMTRSYRFDPVVTSWLGDVPLADSVPVDSGTYEYDSTLRIPDRVTLRVPRVDRGTSWAPVGDDHPLGAEGQRISLGYRLDLPSGPELVDRGDFVITKTSTSGDQVDVEAVGLLRWIDEARFVNPFQPAGTIADTVRALVEPALPVDLTAAPADRSVPAGISWDEDRLGALFELLDAWAADAHVDADGTLVVESAADPTTPVLSLTDGVAGTVVTWAGERTRDGARSLVVARGQDANGGQVQGVAYITGPTALGTPFNPLPVPEFFFSPLLTTTAQARKAAATIARRRSRSAARRVTTTAVPHLGLEAGDLVTLTGAAAGLDQAGAVVESISLPVTAGSGPMVLSCRVVTG